MKQSFYDWCIENDNQYLLDEWDYDKNIDITPYDVSRWIEKKVWWKCHVCGNKWMARIYSVSKGHGCPKCGILKHNENLVRNKLVKGISLGNVYPISLQYWDYEKNKGKTPFDIVPNSMTKVWWKCDNNHSFYLHPNALKQSFSKNKNGCKYCNGKATLAGFNDLKTTHPDLILEWNYDKNIDISPENIRFGSTKKVWWKCNSCGNEWKASPNSRTNNKSGCPECAMHSVTSRLQNKVSLYLFNKYNLEVLHERDCTLIAKNPLTNKELLYDNDVKIANIRLIIEVNGEQHYSITEFTRLNAESRGVSPKEELEYQQYKDKIKMQYAIDMGYEYLSIPYSTEYDDSYKAIIDDKISEILSLTIQN